MKQLLTISINILKEKQAINPGKEKFKEEIGLESLDTPFLHSASHGSGSTVCTGEKAHDCLCHTANSEQADERLHLTPELHYDTDVADSIWQLAKRHLEWKETEKPQWNSNIMSSAKPEEERNHLKVRNEVRGLLSLDCLTLEQMRATLT